MYIYHTSGVLLCMHVCRIYIYVTHLTRQRNVKHIEEKGICVCTNDHVYVFSVCMSTFTPKKKHICVYIYIRCEKKPITILYFLSLSLSTPTLHHTHTLKQLSFVSTYMLLSPDQKSKNKYTGTLQDVWMWHYYVLAPKIYTSHHYNGEKQEGKDRGSILTFNRLTSGFRMVQRRVLNGTGLNVYINIICV